MGRATWVAAAVAVLLVGCAGAPAAQPAAQPASPESSAITVTTVTTVTSPDTSIVPSTTAGTATTLTSTTVTSTTMTSTTVTSTTGVVPSTSGTPDGVVPEGFASIAARSTDSDGTVCELCLWIAEDGEQRARGLMGVTDLGPTDGMAFTYPTPTTGAFWMKNTLMPLSIAFFDGEGRYLDAFDMEPCTADPCERYPTPSGFVVAVEVAQGDLERLGLVPGATLELLGGECP